MIKTMTPGDIYAAIFVGLWILGIILVIRDNNQFIAKNKNKNILTN